MKIDKKISIAIANYNNEKYIDKMLNCLINQSYENLEIIVVNDGSPGNCDEIMAKYNDSRIKYIKHERNKGLFQTRLTGASNATGDYIAFLDVDDYVSYDYFRMLVTNAEKNNSDIVVGNMILEYDDGKQEYFNLFNTNYDELNGSECLDEYFRQEGLNFSWHTGCNQLYSMDLWRKAEKHYSKINKRLLMTEDFAFSTVLFYYARKVTKIDYDCLFYCKHDKTSTSINDISYKKEESNIYDLITSFNFVEDFLKEKKVYDKYKKNFTNWKRLYANMHRTYINNSKKLTVNEKQNLNKLMDSYCKDKEKIKCSEVFSSIVSKWDPKLNDVKKAIGDDSIKIVSFDIFDTLVVRPFLKPSDLFKLLDVEYRKKVNGGIDFSEMREICETISRDRQYKANSSIEEIDLDSIYKIIYEIYNVDKKVLNLLKEKEQELEIRFCSVRETAYDLYSLALQKNKKIICTSDMYLPYETINRILKKNGYNNISKIYLSSEIKKTKSTGNLFKYLLEDQKCSPSEIIHIGDNKESDYDIPKKMGINSIHFYKAIDVFFDSSKTNALSQIFSTSMPFWIDNRESIQFLGIRSMLAVVANRYFDNPFRPFNEKTDFNADPFLIGYYAMGMHVFGVANWLLKNTSGKNDKISFMARDGYLVMEAYQILKDLYSESAESSYMYVSRKALIPVMIESELDFYRLSEIIDFSKNSPKTVLKHLKNVLAYDEDNVEKICKKNNIPYEKKFKSIVDFNLYIKLLIDNFYDKEKHLKNRTRLKKYFLNNLGNCPAVFDIGYSGRPEYYLSRLCSKSISTYFLNINGDKAKKYSLLGNFGVNTYFDYKPVLTGNAYELLHSKMAPSCVGYTINELDIEPVFEEYNPIYSVDYIIQTIQKATLMFITDIKTIFDEYLQYMHYQNSYISLPFLAYLNSSCRLDKLVLDAVMFEDEIKSSNCRKMIDDMEEEAKNKNQLPLRCLANGSILKFDNEPVKVGNLYYNPFVDLNDKGKIRRLLYYILYDRKTIKRRIEDISNKRKKH